MFCGNLLTSFLLTLHRLHEKQNEQKGCRRLRLSRLIRFLAARRALGLPTSEQKSLRTQIVIYVKLKRTCPPFRT